jgi:hypothetical protein
MDYLSKRLNAIKENDLFEYPQITISNPPFIKRKNKMDKRIREKRFYQLRLVLFCALILVVFFLKKNGISQPFLTSIEILMYGGIWLDSSYNYI